MQENLQGFFSRVNNPVFLYTGFFVNLMFVLQFFFIGKGESISITISVAPKQPFSSIFDGSQIMQMSGCKTVIISLSSFDFRGNGTSNGAEKASHF